MFNKYHRLVYPFSTFPENVQIVNDNMSLYIYVPRFQSNYLTVLVVTYKIIIPSYILSGWGFLSISTTSTRILENLIAFYGSTKNRIVFEWLEWIQIKICMSTFEKIQLEYFDIEENSFLLLSNLT